jgi:hypothetical protein
MFYEYDQGVLRIKHINAGFNCCPGEIDMKFDFQGDAIHVFESESEAGCFCQCLFDLDAWIVGLEPGVYRIVVHEPYVIEGDEPLAFRIDLSQTASGIHCVERNHYPWGD